MIDNDSNTHGSDGPAHQGAPVFLVLEKDALIAEDIAGSLKSFEECRVILVKAPDEILAHLSAEPRLDAAFLEMRLAQVMETGLGRHLSDRGAHIILTVGEDDQDITREKGWGMLVRPFTDQMVRETLRSLQRKT